MRARHSVIILVAWLLGASSARAHWLDQYLQATTLQVASRRVEGRIRLTPGIAVFRDILRLIDRDDNGSVTPTEQAVYAARVIGDLTMAIDGQPLSLQHGTVTMSPMADLRDGRGAIQIDFSAALPLRAGRRQLTFTNAHQRAIAVYLVNAIIPDDSLIRIDDQSRGPDQAHFALEYVVASGSAHSAPLTRAAFSWWWTGAAALAAIATSCGVQVRARRRGANRAISQARIGGS